MTDVYDIYLEVLDKVNKEENGYLPADLFNRYSRVANRHVFNDYIARLQDERTASVEKQKLEDRLAPFVVTAFQSATAGLFTLPPGCAYFRAARLQADSGAVLADILALQAQLCEAETDPTIDIAAIQKQLKELVSGQSWVGIDLMDHDRLGKRLNSHVPGKRPSLSKPVMERAMASGARAMQVYPKTDMSVLFTYYRRPADAKLVMTPDPGTQEPFYDPLLSDGFEWEEEAMGDIVGKIATDFSVYLRETGLFQMTQAEQKP